MHKIILKYIFSFSIVSVLMFILFNYYLLPVFVDVGSEIYLPDVRGEYLQNSRYILSSSGFRIKEKEIAFNENHTPGKVIRMSPRAFTKVKKGRVITLSIAGHQKDLMMPGLVSQTYRNAKIILKDNGLKLDTTIYEYNEDFKENVISFQVPKKDKIIKTGSYVVLGVSKGGPPEYYIVPDLIGEGKCL